MATSDTAIKSVETRLRRGRSSTNKENEAPHNHNIQGQKQSITPVAKSKRGRPSAAKRSMVMTGDIYTASTQAQTPTKTQLPTIIDTDEREDSPDLYRLVAAVQLPHIEKIEEDDQSDQDDDYDRQHEYQHEDGLDDNHRVVMLNKNKSRRLLVSRPSSSLSNISIGVSSSSSLESLREYFASLDRQSLNDVAEIVPVNEVDGLTGTEEDQRRQEARGIHSKSQSASAPTAPAAKRRKERGLRS